MGNRRNRKSEMRRKRATWHYKRTRNVFVGFFFMEKERAPQYQMLHIAQVI